MPIYEYRCEKCNHEFEELIRNDKQQAELACPQCGHKQVSRKLSVFAAREAQAAPPPAGPCGQCEQQGGCPYSSG
jgi:putative FmdB family regulatory protein